MAVSIGNFSIAGAAVGGVPAKALALGATTVWQQVAPAPVTGDWLCFTATQANSTVRLDKVGSPGAVSLETSTDGTTWTDYSWSGGTGDTATLTGVGDKVYFRAKSENQTIGSSSSDYYQFKMTGQIAASGNIQTLLKADGSRTDVPAYCYRRMFYGCTSLTTAPTLPATTLSTNCYVGMFELCSSLTTAPELPATTLFWGCYSSMFVKCTALTSAPDLPATTLDKYCYDSMFRSCTHISSVEVAFTTWVSEATDNWLDNVASSGTFTCPAALPDERGSGKIPNNWTKVDIA